MPSNNNRGERSKYVELVDLTEQLSHHTDIASQITYIIRTLERVFSCDAAVWLADDILAVASIDRLHDNNINILDRNEIVVQACQTRQPVPSAFSAGGIESPLVLALPIIARDRILGVFQLKRLIYPGFSQEECQFAADLVLLASISLDELIQHLTNSNLQKNIEHLTYAVQLSKSIASNLNRDNLLNSIITLIHQQYGMPYVYIYLMTGDKAFLLDYIGISPQGVQAKHTYQLSGDKDPVFWCITHRQTVTINNLQTDSLFSTSSRDADLHSLLLLPLLSGDSCLGALELSSYSVNAFTPELVENLHSLAENIAIAVRNASLYRSELLRSEIYETLHAEIGEITAETSLDDMMERLLKVIEKFLPWDISSIWLYDEVIEGNLTGPFSSAMKLAASHVSKQNSVTYQEYQRQNIDIIQEQLSHDGDRSMGLLNQYPWITEVLSSNQPISRNQLSPYEIFGGLLSFPAGYSAIGVPLVFNGYPGGVITLVAQEPDQYSGEALAIYKAFAEYASIAIGNTLLFTSAHDQLWVSTVLLQVAATTQSQTDLDDLSENIVSMITDLIGANACIFYLWDQSTEAFFPQATAGFTAEQQGLLNSWDVYPGTVPAFDNLYRSRSPIILDSETIPDEIALNIFPSYDLHTDLLILFPLVAQDDFLGALLIDFSNSSLEKKSAQKLWDDRYLLIQGISQQTAVAIENLQAIKNKEEEAYISVALLQVAQAIVSLNQLDEILAAVVRITPILVGVKRCIIYIWNNASKVFQPAQNYGFTKNELQVIGQVIRSEEFPLVHEVFETNKIAYHPLEQSSTPSSWSEIEAGNFKLIEAESNETGEQSSMVLDDVSLRDKSRLLIGFPLYVKSEGLGVMLVEEEDPVRGSPSYHIREKRIEIVKGITQLAAVAIKNEILQQEAVKSERMERELQLAREIQQTFLPDHLPELVGWDMDVRWKPARQVGGDFYDFLSLGNNCFGLVIADVADKGMPAALFMTLIRTLVRAAARDDLSPANVLNQVNELLIPDAKHGMFVTVFYAVIYLDSGRIVYTNAGHNPPVIMRLNSGEFTELTRTSMALGIFNNIEIQEKEVRLSPGDGLFLYTDGVTEAFSEKEEMFGSERLYDVLAHTEFSSARELVDRVEGSVYEFIKDAELSDDLTIAAIFRKQS